MPAAFTGELLTPQVNKEDTRLPASRRVQGNDPFTLAFTHQWEFIPGTNVDPEGSPHVHPDGEWLPELTEIRHTPGANGVSVVNGRVNAGRAIHGMTQKGAVVIRQNDPLLGEYRQYLARFGVRNGLLPRKQPYHHVLAGVRMKVIANGTRCVPIPDPEWCFGLRRQVVKSRLVEPMDAEQLDERVLRVQNRIGRLRNQRMQGPGAGERIEEYRRLIAAMRAAWERQYGDADDGPGEYAEGRVVVEEPVEIDGVVE